MYGTETNASLGAQIWNLVHKSLKYSKKILNDLL